MSSPYINRFLQPDDIVSNPFGSQSWNRFSYTLNNPIRFNDPTGHIACDGEDMDDCSGNTPPNLHVSANPGTPDEINPDKLLTQKAKEKGKELYGIYVSMWNKKDGWWWGRYGSGGFTIWEFMSIFWGYEQGWYPKTEDFVSALSNKSPVWCQARGCQPDSAEGSLYFLASYSQSARNRINCLSSGYCTLDGVFYKPPKSWANNPMLIVEGIQGSAFTGYPKSNELYDVGNISLRSEIYRKMVRLEMAQTVWGQSGQDRMIILTFCQSQMVNYAVFNGGAKAINLNTYSNFCGGR